MSILRWLLTILFGLSGASLLWAQNEGDIWVMGYATYTPNLPDFGLSYWDFGDINPVIEYDIHIRFRIEETAASISRDDAMILMTNGMQIITPELEFVVDTIAFLGDGENWKYYFSDQLGFPFGFPKQQTALILPVPGSSDEYSVIYYHATTQPSTLHFAVTAVLETRLLRLKDGSWSVLYKDMVVLENEFLSEGDWHACRHANGRDWWILIHDWEGHNYYQLLLDRDSLSLIGSEIWPEGRNLSTNAWFSPDGSKYAKIVAGSINEDYLFIYDFDRCTGSLSNRTEIVTTGTAMAFQGISFSPNSRYLFQAVDTREIYQYDLQSEDIAASRMLVDTNDGYVEPGWFNTSFGPMMPGHDGRIYMFPISGSSRAVHVIDRPNERGKDTKLLQHHIMLQTSKARSVQNFPNFRLGPLDGSPCDTLGIDNHPQARWRYEIEDADPQEIRFTDLSFFRPEVWHWDFGDGEISSTPSPIHIYASPGEYYVCLTVSNEYSSDTSCQWIEIESVSTDDITTEAQYIVHPNPFTDHIEITPTSQDGGYDNLFVRLIDIHGRSITALEMTCPCRLRLGNLPAGVYFYTLEEDGKVVGSGKVVKTGH